MPCMLYEKYQLLFSNWNFNTLRIIRKLQKGAPIIFFAYESFGNFLLYCILFPYDKNLLIDKFYISTNSCGLVYRKQFQHIKKQSLLRLSRIVNFLASNQIISQSQSHHQLWESENSVWGALLFFALLYQKQSSRYLPPVVLQHPCFCSFYSIHLPLHFPGYY